MSTLHGDQNASGNSNPAPNDEGADAAAIPLWLPQPRSVSRLTHPNSVPVFEADVQDNQPYLVFAYVAGRTLSTLRSNRGALAPLEAAALICDGLDALVAAHADGIIHRDLEPPNILIDEAGRAQVMGVGMAAPTTPSEQSRRAARPTDAHLVANHIAEPGRGAQAQSRATGFDGQLKTGSAEHRGNDARGQFNLGRRGSTH